MLRNRGEALIQKEFEGIMIRPDSERTPPQIRPLVLHFDKNMKMDGTNG